MNAAGKSLLERFNGIIESNLNNPAFNIDDACRELGTSRSQLFRQIKAESNLSTSLYIRRRRLEKARVLLRTSDKKTSEIAYLVGIDSPQNFSKYFSQEFGVTPSAFRKEIPENETAEPVSRVTVTAPTKSKRRYYSYAAAGIILLSAVSIYLFLTRTETPVKSEFGFVGNSIAIMPFKNLGSSQTEFYCDGIARQIHGSLSLNEELKVISTTSSVRYKTTTKSIPDIAKELDVNYILEGSVFQDKNKLRVSVGLVRVQDDRTIWTKSYDGSDEEIFSFISDVSKEVAYELGQKLTAEARKRIEKIPTSSPAAYREYLRGSQLIVAREKSRLEESVVKFSNAIEFDPEFADAYAHLGHAYQLLGAGAFIDEKLSFKLAEENSLKAIRLDTENALAYANLANVYQAEYKWEQATTAHQIALQYNPNDALVNYWYSLLLRQTGDPKQAFRFSSKAVELDPLHHVIYGGNIGNCVIAGEMDLAKKYIEDGKVLFNDSWVYYWASSTYYAALNNFDMAITQMDRSIELGPGIRITRYTRAYYQGRAGRDDQVHAYLESLPDSPTFYIARAVSYAGLGDQQKSMDFLAKAADEGILMTDLAVSPILNMHRDDPRFKAILTKFNLNQ
jgi:TolB-like protein/AraC-like DNA-binding protein